ncbi:TIGR00730 family Rossman fold protein [Beggiatoa leptomitoformis]|uniref:Cytokinin riboside 5'-monophosphate phosphoribohydrolase n=1 Tax=Beggiatoa leptomitoformis TaxID=288004 RepID=A0A2N9YB92_9GAMM|nr:TIGR00730 family Rossman fold protein [Beggiatoa leptomitoformis]ALG66903.1 TIGR00730 family Rossman fold protein [Beggiatoa leptomitoformis]AUI67736.1 TIGR00730 family Rossman fold protein [Beggiatoa leptomitoformis]
MKSISVFTGANKGSHPNYSHAAQTLGKALVKRDITLVYGGGNIGLMGVLADAVLAEGGNVIGVIPEFLVAKEVAHQGLTELIIVNSMHERKAKMMELSDGFIAMPGGWGTLDELFEILTWSQLGLHNSPCGLLNIAGYFGYLLEFLEHAVAQGFLRSEHLESLLVEERPERLLQAFEDYHAPTMDKWIDRV